MCIGEHVIHDSLRELAREGRPGFALGRIDVLFRDGKIQKGETTSKWQPALQTGLRCLDWHLLPKRIDELLDALNNRLW